jgi:hypothetical protein
MQLQTSSRRIDFYPIGSGRRFVKCVTWHPGTDNEIKSFSTRYKSDYRYDVNQAIMHGAEVIGFNLEEYKGKDYSPLYC